jgi:hypothetical protein
MSIAIVLFRKPIGKRKRVRGNRNELADDLRCREVTTQGRCAFVD